MLLFCVVANFQTKVGDTIEASSGAGKLLPIYKVKTEEKKVALTMNCAWNADDIDKILETLKQNNVKITFFMVGDWIEKNPEAVKKINEAGQEIRKSQ
jgi:esterase (fragment)